MIEYVHVTCQQDAFPYPEQVDPLRDIAVPDTQQTAGGAAGDILQFSAQTCFNTLCQFHQFLQLFHRRKNGAVASHIGADADQLDVNHLVFDVFCHIDQLVLIPPAFPQVSHISHQNDLMKFPLVSGFLVERLDHFQLAVQADIRQTDHILHLAEHRNTDQHHLFIDACISGIFYLFQT